MNRLRSLLHSARFLLIVLPVVGTSVAVAVGCSQVASDGEDSNAAISNNSGYGYGYGGSSGNGNDNNDGYYGYGYGGGDDDSNDNGYYGYGYGH